MTGCCRFVFIFCVLWSCLSPAVEHSPLTDSNWSTIDTPFRPVNATAVGNVIWVCGTNEMIVSSADGGVTWEISHQNRDGEVLSNVSFVDEKVGHAAGTGGLLLSTADGGKTWQGHKVSRSIFMFSFADANNGIVLVSRDAGAGNDLIEDDLPSYGTVKITHDGGEHWQDVALESDELRPFTGVLSVAALDSSHYLMLRRHPEIEDAFVVTKDSGKSWKLVHPQNDSSNRALPKTVFVHQGEYWAFGHALVHREKGGGYGVPLTLRSKDGETWVHGTPGPNEFKTCNAQGCFLWDGAVEALYSDHAQFWSTPQDGSLSDKWAIANKTICTVSGSLKCALASTAGKPQPRREDVTFARSFTGNFASGCLECRVSEIIPDSPAPPSMKRLQALLTVRRDGSVSDVSVDYPSSEKTRAAISEQLSQWLFEPAREGANTVEAKKQVELVLMCAGFPGQPETDRCSLHPSHEFSKPTQRTTTSPQ